MTRAIKDEMVYSDVVHSVLTPLLVLGVTKLSLWMNHCMLYY